MIKVSIANRQETLTVSRERLREVVRAVLAGEGENDADISIALVDNPTIHALNKRFLEHDEPTDVLSFPMSGPGAKILEGELIVGAEVAIAQAAERRHTPEAELDLYVIHGLLHLCGYDDLNEADARDMRAKEREYLAKVGLPDIAPE